MLPAPPPRPFRPTVPLAYGAADGAVIPHAGRYARECVLLAFEMIGGVERMAAWAQDNPGEFYTKLYTKVITRSVEADVSDSVEDLLARLDRGGLTASQTELLEAELVEAGADSDSADDHDFTYGR